MGGVSGNVVRGTGTPRVRVFADLDTVSLRVAEATVRTLNEAVHEKGRCSLVLSGGSTPRTLYALLASRFRDQIPWEAVHVFWGDERYVPADDPRSNYRLAKETLLDLVPCPAGNIHRMPTDRPQPDEAARDYEALLRVWFADDIPAFDVLLLGLGKQGHTASLFPHSPALTEKARWTAAVTVPADPPERLTLTLPALTHAAATYFVVAGGDKADAVAHVLAPNADPTIYPAAGVRPVTGDAIWWLDEPAAREYTSKSGGPAR